MGDFPWLPTEEELGELTGFSQFFLICCYGALLFYAAGLIGEGSEMLLLLYGPGIVGGLIIPILGAVPDGAIVLVSGLGDDAQTKLAVGVGTLAGSTVMLLTIPWALGVYFGYRDLDPDTGKAAVKPGTNKPKADNPISLTQSVVTTYDNVPAGAKIMMLTAVSYLIVQIPAFIYKHSSKEDKRDREHIPALVGLICCVVAFIGYSVYQLYDAKAQSSVALKENRLKFEKWQKSMVGKFQNKDKIVRTIFEKMDKDGSGKIDRAELQQGFKELGLEISRNEVNRIMKEMNEQAKDTGDKDDDTLDFEEFKVAIDRWSRLLNRGQTQGSIPISTATSDDEEPMTDAQPLVSPRSDGEMEEEEEEGEDEMMELTDSQVLRKSLWLLVAGTLIVTFFSDPMCDAISAFGNKIGVDPFFVSFLITPMASNASEVYSALLFARKKTSEGISLAFSSLYGAASMNNTFVLAIFFAIIYLKKLIWTFSVETISILLTIYVVGILALPVTIQAWRAIPIICMYPIALLLNATLQDALDD